MYSYAFGIVSSVILWKRPLLPFGDRVDRATERKRYQGKKMRVIRSDKIEALMECQVIFIPEAESRDISAVLSRLNAKWETRFAST